MMNLNEVELGHCGILRAISRWVAKGFAVVAVGGHHIAMHKHGGNLRFLREGCQLLTGTLVHHAFDGYLQPAPCACTPHALQLHFMCGHSPLPGSKSR